MKNTRFVILILGTFHLSALLTHLCCSKPSTTQPEPQRPQIEVTEDITNDTVWKEGTDIIVKGSIAVDSSATLTIEPNVCVTFEDEESVLEIYGSMIADGQNENTQVTFKTTEEQEAGGRQRCLTAYESSAMNLDFCSFDGFQVAVKSEQGSVIIEKSVFENCSRGLYNVQADTCLVSNSLFRDNEFDVIFEQVMYNSVKKNLVMNCEFINSINTGVNVTNQSYVTIYNNQFMNCKTGILYEHSSNGMIHHNSFSNCETSIRFFKNFENGEILRNEFTNSDNDIYLYQSYPVINYNNLIICKGYKIISSYNNDTVVNAENNWWNTVEEEEISLSIQDANDIDARSDAGLIDYLPILYNKLEDAGIIQD